MSFHQALFHLPSGLSIAHSLHISGISHTLILTAVLQNGNYPPLHRWGVGVEWKFTKRWSRCEPRPSALRVCALSTDCLGCLCRLGLPPASSGPAFICTVFFLIFRLPTIFLFVRVPEEASLSPSAVTTAAATS